MKSRTISLVRVCFFTEKAENLFEKLKASNREILWQKLEDKSVLCEWTKESFEKSIPLLFICAAGIATRTIAPFVKDKFTDSPVLVMDEEGRFIIPILSGHLGNANEIAFNISRSINAQPVITTGTDVNGKFSIDNFAKINGLKIVNHEGIKKNSARILAGEKIKVFIEDTIKISALNMPSEIVLVKNAGEEAHVAVTLQELSDDEKNRYLINLVPKKYCLGIGCKKGKTFNELKSFAETIFSSHFHAELRNEVVSISSINLKEEETGILEFSHWLHVPFITYTAEELIKAQGDFSESDFVKEITGVPNVCERSAVLAAGKDGHLVLSKTAENGMTISVAEKKPIIEKWK